MSFTLTLDLTEPVGGGNSTGKMLVRPNRLLLDADGTGAVIYTTTEREVQPANGVCAVSLPSTDEFDGDAWFGVRWTGHMTGEPVWVPAQASGDTTTVRQWVNDPQVIPPPVAALPDLYAQIAALQQQIDDLRAGDGVTPSNALPLTLPHTFA